MFSWLSVSAQRNGTWARVDAQYRAGDVDQQLGGGVLAFDLPRDPLGVPRRVTVQDGDVHRPLGIEVLEEPLIERVQPLLAGANASRGLDPSRVVVDVNKKLIIQ